MAAAASSGAAVETLVVGAAAHPEALVSATNSIFCSNKLQMLSKLVKVSYVIVKLLENYEIWCI